MGIEFLLDMAAGAHGDRPALGPMADRYSYAGLRRASRAGARALLDAGCGSVVFIGVGSPVVPTLIFAAAYAGQPYTPLNYRLGPDQLAEQLSVLDRPYVVADAAFHGALDKVPGTVQGSAKWLIEMRAAGEVKLEEPDQPTAVVLFTSGTTSTPKRVLLSHENLTSYVLHTVEFASAGPDEAALISVPPYHIAGIGTILTNVFAGRRMAYLPNFAPGDWLDTVRCERITSAMVVPTMVARLTEYLGGSEADVPSLRSLAYGGARMPLPVVTAALRSFPGVDFVNAYGLTETSSTIALLSPDDHREAIASGDPAIAARLSSAGRLVPGVEGQIRDDDDNVRPAGEPGQLWVRGPQVSGYYQGIGSVLDAAGWFPTRDCAFFDSGGYLFITGRTDDVIIRGGENIAPAEIEDVLVHHPAVAQVAVVGLPDDDWGERIVAAVVPRSDEGASTDASELRSWVRERLRGSRTPDDIIWTDALPFSPTGKLLRNELRAMLIGRTTESARRG
jgi:acyl-CoA synthetase (AMP-forming)/AMP-acid ligase II